MTGPKVKFKLGRKWCSLFHCLKISFKSRWLFSSPKLDNMQKRKTLLYLLITLIIYKNISSSFHNYLNSQEVQRFEKSWKSKLLSFQLLNLNWNCVGSHYLSISLPQFTNMTYLCIPYLIGLIFWLSGNRLSYLSCKLANKKVLYLGNMQEQFTWIHEPQDCYHKLFGMVVKHGRLVKGTKRIPLHHLQRTKHTSTINLWIAKNEIKSREHASRSAGMSSDMSVADNGATRVSEDAKLDSV